MADFVCSSFFKRLYLFLERREGREREGENNQCVVVSQVLPTRDPAHNPGMWPDWESNRWLFGSQASTQSTEPQQPGLVYSSWKETKVD